MSTVSEPPVQHDDSNELAQFGYKQELDRSLGSFSSFAAGFSYISILTGVFQLFGLAFLFAGPAFFWSWPVVFIGQFLVALCFAELAGQFPLAGSVYQWSKQIARPLTSWMAGWLLLVGSIVTVAAVAVAYQVILPQVTTSFQIVGSAADAGLTNTPGGAQNAVILAVGLVAFTTIINMIGVKLMARINNVGVAAELVGVTLLIILLALHITRGPDVVFETNGTGAGHDWGYFGAWLLGVDRERVRDVRLRHRRVAGRGDEQPAQARAARDPPRARRRRPGRRAADHRRHDVGEQHQGRRRSGRSGCRSSSRTTLGETLGDIFLLDSALAITVCALAVHTAGIRMMFSMARDNRLPLGSRVARVSGKSKTPIVPALVIGGLTVVLLVINIGNQRVFSVLVSVAIILFYLAYLCVTGPMLIARLRGEWPRTNHGPYFSLGRWGMLVNAVAVAYGTVGVVNLAWPREEIYGADHWYFQ